MARLRHPVLVMSAMVGCLDTFSCYILLHLPRGQGAVGPDAAGVMSSGGNGAEGSVRGIGGAFSIVTPADHGAVGLEPAYVLGTRADFCKCTGGGRAGAAASARVTRPAPSARESGIPSRRRRRPPSPRRCDSPALTDVYLALGPPSSPPSVGMASPASSVAPGSVVGRLTLSPTRPWAPWSVGSGSGFPF